MKKAFLVLCFMVASVLVGISVPELGWFSLVLILVPVGCLAVATVVSMVDLIREIYFPRGDKPDRDERPKGQRGMKQ